MTRFYKVVSSLDLSSTDAYPPFQVFYKLGAFVHPNPKSIKNGRGLFVFKNYESALKYKNECTRKVDIYECEVTNPRPPGEKLILYKMIYDIYENSHTPFPEGTVEVSSVKLIRLVLSGKGNIAYALL